MLALIGGGEWQAGCDFDHTLLEASGGGDVLVLPTGAAYEHPQRLVDAAIERFEGLGVKARGVDVLRRPDAFDVEVAAEVRRARFVYLAGASPMHLRSVLKDTPVWDALVASWLDGAVLAGSSAGAMVLTDPMVDPRGGAFTVGLGVVAPLAVIPGIDQWSEDKVHRTRVLAPKAIPVVGVEGRTALIRDLDGSWRADGAGAVQVWVAGKPADLSVLPTSE
ncbi:MAG: Type 1 glutamine amidotransferase-like domain-containing protein [Actinomycetota bacterium]|nr:Type 1 glutamine amidotransferase-like domain-containing protein [Actinomycetota bacterium]